MTRLLLERGANIMKPDLSGSTPLHLAAEYGSERLMKLLLEKCADPHKTDFLGTYASFQGRSEWERNCC